MAPLASMACAVVLALASVATAQDRPTKPVINPLLHLSTDVLNQHMPPVAHHWVEDWADIHILDWCKDQTRARGMDVNDVETFNVHYNDCNQPWIMCRHKGSAVSKQQMIETWGRIPLGLREHVRHIILWPTMEHAGFMTGQNLAFQSAYFNIWTLIHETSHSVDFYGLRHLGNPFSESQQWKDAYGRDSAVPASNSHSTWAEHLADIAPQAVYNRNVPGGLGAIYPHWTQIQNSVELLQWALGDNLVSGHKNMCTHRLQNYQAVLKRDSMRIRSDEVKLPDTQIRDENIEIIPSLRMNMESRPLTPEVAEELNA